MKMVLAVGLTGGHIYPALALTEEFESGECQFLFVACRRSLLAPRILDKAGHAVLPLDLAGMARGLDFFKKGPLFLYQQAAALRVMRRALHDWQPHVVIGFGGYVSFPVVLAAKLLGLPTMIYEPNVRMGLANLILSPFADRVAFSLQKPADGAGSRYVAVRPPLRRNLLAAKNLAAGQARQRLGLAPEGPCLVVLGGSQGSAGINTALRQVVGFLKEEGVNFSFFHMSGDRDFEATQSFYAQRGLLGSRGRCVSYWHDMGFVYRAADLVVGRAGAMTCLELLAFEVFAYLIPYPHATAAHQELNARYLEQLGRAKIVKETTTLQQQLQADIKKEFSRSPYKRVFKEQGQEARASLGELAAILSRYSH